ncbi:MAG: outer membrane beta-barrel family protein, partial [Bacteroidota bacterium]|nr:outer membrane beta-barrel family protein [Bacteroidota bacterium]
TDITDSTNIQFGNPDLDPVFSHSFELNLIRTTDDLSLSASMYHRIAENDIQSISYLDNGVMFQTSSNVTRNSSSGLELVGKSKLTNLAELTGTIDGFYSEMDPFTYRGYYYKGNSGFSWNARLNGTLIFSKSLTGELSGFYNAPAIIAQGKSKSNYTLDAGLRKSFFDKQLQIALNGRNLLNSFKFASTTWGSGFYQTSSSQFFSRSIQLNVTWNFGNMKPKKDIKEENNNSNSGNNMDSEY